MNTKEILYFILEMLKIVFSVPVLIFIFRSSIMRILPMIGDRLKILKTPFGEFELEPQTSNTAFGRTNVSMSLSKVQMLV